MTSNYRSNMAYTPMDCSDILILAELVDGPRNKKHRIDRTWSPNHLVASHFGQGERWVTADGRTLFISEMDSSHALDSLLFLERVTPHLFDSGIDNLQGTVLYQALKARASGSTHAGYSCGIDQLIDGGARVLIRPVGPDSEWTDLGYTASISISRIDTDLDCAYCDDGQGRSDGRGCAACNDDADDEGNPLPHDLLMLIREVLDSYADYRTGDSEHDEHIRIREILIDTITGGAGEDDDADRVCIMDIAMRAFGRISVGITRPGRTEGEVLRCELEEAGLRLPEDALG
ncbi:MAG: hypothetical protein V4703_08615 [Actinomycetota bacterium]